MKKTDIEKTLYDNVVLKDTDGRFLGNIYCRVIPRIGESIQVTKRYEIINIVYNVEWERISSVDVIVKEIA